MSEVSGDAALAGKVAVVTAASRGIGRAIARRLAADGAAVVVNWYANRQAADDLVGEIARAGGHALAVRADMGADGDVEELFTATRDRFGGFDILVNNAGISPGTATAEMTAADFDRMVAVNVKGTFLAMQQAARHMRPGGRIVNISTGYTRAVYPNVGVYAGTKAAVEHMGMSLAKELGPQGITVNSVLPGIVDTDGLSADVREQLDALIAMTPLGRVGQADDIADVVAFLVSDAARWVTGQSIAATGGLA